MLGGGLQLWRRPFTLVEIIIAIVIFAFSTLILLERRGAAIETSYRAAMTLRALSIVDEVIMRHRLYPFEMEAIPLEKDYAPFNVKVSVEQESINILPEDWRLEEEFLEEGDQQKERIILRVSVEVNFPRLNSDEMYAKAPVSVSTLIRHIELNLKKDER